MDIAFLDTNVLLRHLRQDQQVHSPKATNIIVRIERGDLQVRISDTVIFETVFTLQRTYKISKDQIAEILLPIIELPGIVLPGKRLYSRVFDLYCSTNLSFADCYHIVLMESLGIEEIISFDRGFDRISTIRRIEE